MTTTIFGVNGNGANGPAVSTAFTGNIVQGTLFKVTADGYTLSGYGLWRADANQAANASFALWKATGNAAGTLVASSTVSITGMTAGAWNYVSLPTPLALTKNQTYKAQFGTVNNFPFTGNSFNVGGVYPAGITVGALVAFSDATGTAPDPFNDGQCTFNTTTADPAAVYAISINTAYNCWVDVQVQAPPVTGQQQQSGRSMLRKRLQYADL